MKTLLLAPILVASVLTSPSPSAAPPAAATTPQAVLMQILTAPNVSPQWFDASLLSAAPATRVDAVLASMRRSLGVFQYVEALENGSFRAHFSKGTVLCQISLDNDGKVAGLLFGPPEVRRSSLTDALSAMRSTSNATSYVVIRNGNEVAAFGQSRALSIGSTFKLSVLSALQEAVAHRRLRWSDTVALRRTWKSLPTGLLQTWPDGTPLTLASLATLMISRSDNTAADILIHVVNRGAIVPYAYGNTPFLTTHDLFVLKSTEGAALRTAWRGGDPAQKALIVTRLDSMPLPALTQLDTSPADSDIEWHYTNRQLCSLMKRVEALPLMTVNPGIENPSLWKRVAYKGGSDVGVISMTAWLTAKGGDNYCVSATRNSTTQAIDETAFINAFDGIADFLATAP